jgi:hypothetical protein
MTVRMRRLTGLCTESTRITFYSSRSDVLTHSITKSPGIKGTDVISYNNLNLIQIWCDNNHTVQLDTSPSQKVSKLKIPDILCEEILVNQTWVESNDRFFYIYARGDFNPIASVVLEIQTCNKKLYQSVMPMLRWVQ